MASQSIEVMNRPGQLKALQKIESLTSRLSNLRERFESTSARIQSTAVAGAAGYALGAMQKDYRARNNGRGEAMPTVMNLNPGLVYGVATFVAAELIGGRTAEIIHSASTGLVAVAAYQMGMESSDPPGRRAAEQSTASTPGQITSR